MRGIFITFEGVEGCGKSTQSRLLKEYLEDQGKKVILTREPGGTPIAESIRKILLDSNNKEMLAETELLLYSASRAQHTGEKIIPALARGEVVISDRYYDSTVAYQGAARQIKGNEVDNLCCFASYGIEPDITFLIDVPVEIGLSRIEEGKADRLEQESVEFHQKVREGFLALAAIKKRIIIIDGQKTIDEISGMIKRKLEEIITVRS